MSSFNELDREALCVTTWKCLSDSVGVLGDFPKLLKKLILHKAWERRIVRGQVVELKTLRELITSRPPAGWNEDPSKVEAALRDDPEALVMFREQMKHQGERTDLNEDNFRNIVPEVGDGQPRGNSLAYSITRAKASCDPVTAAAVMAGEMSANAALVKAGLRECRQVYISRDPVKAVEKLRRLFGDAFWDEMKGVSNGSST